MKIAVLFMAIAIGVTLAACKKDDRPPLPESASYFFGRWKAIAEFSSSGAMGEWKPLSDGAWISFIPNGRFEATELKFNAYRIDSIAAGAPVTMKPLVVLYNIGKDEKDASRYAALKIAGDTVELWYQSCFEGCAVRYARIR